MPKGIEAVVDGDSVELAFAPDVLSESVGRLFELAYDPYEIRIDTGGTHTTYHVPVDLARAAGMLDTPAAPAEIKPVKKAPVKKAPAKKVAPPAAPTAPVSPPEPVPDE